MAQFEVIRTWRGEREMQLSADDSPSYAAPLVAKDGTMPGTIYIHDQDDYEGEHVLLTRDQLVAALAFLDSQEARDCVND